MTAPPVHLHAVEPRSRANGPGVRFVLWFQGCSLGCPGCFNPGTHTAAQGSGDAGGSRSRPVADLVADIVAQGAAIDGITLSGGEPLEQPEAALALVRAVRGAGELSILVFSGYAIGEIRARPGGAEFLAHIDVLVDGRYRASERLGRGLRGSQNQRIHLLTERYTLADVEATPEAEIRIDARGIVTLTGVNPLKLKG
jgi:anaerobic ribonucleoside-triphosphate reductase activating protein